MNNKKVVITQPSNPTENIQVKPDLSESDSLGDIILAIAVLITAIAKLVEVSVPVMKKNNK
ncbi:MAG: hypothetical protein F6K17_14125 [Okeania sp. SIO3C4]|nr:hypothetical protein [Okeania sp. SIO3C4]